MKNSEIITIERKMKIFIFIFPTKQHPISNSTKKNDTIERDYTLRETVKMKQPLAHRMRPTNIQEIIGQQHLVGEGKILWRMVQANHFQSMILYGPPGTGKTSIASAIAGSTGTPFRLLNAVTHNKKIWKLSYKKQRCIDTSF